MITYGKYIELKREEKGYSQRKLGIISGVSNTTISRIENDETVNPQIKTLKRIEKALGLAENEIVHIAYPPKESIIKNCGNSPKETLVDEIMQLLVIKGVMQEGEELSAEKREWLIDLLSKAIDMSRM